MCLGIRPDPPTQPPCPASGPRPDFSRRSAAGRAGAGAAPGVGARSWTPTGGDPSSRIGKDVGHPLPLQKTHPDLGAGRGVEAFPAFWKEDLGVEAAPPSVASPRWPPCGSLGLLKPKVVPVAGNPGVPFVYQLKLQAGTVGEHPPVLKPSAPYPFPAWSACSLFSGHSSRFHS